MGAPMPCIGICQRQTAHFLFRGIEYGKIIINVILILNEKSIINIVYFHFSQSKLVKSCTVELLSWMTKIRFLPTLIYMSLFFFIKNITRKYVLVNLLLMKCILIFVSVYFLCCDTLKKNYTTTFTLIIFYDIPQIYICQSNLAAELYIALRKFFC